MDLRHWIRGRGGYVAPSEDPGPSADSDAGVEGEPQGPRAVAMSSGGSTDSLPVYTPPRRATPRALVAGGVRFTRGLPAPPALAPAHLAETTSATPSLFGYVSAAAPASAGLWYDALAAASDQVEARPSDARARAPATRCSARPI